MGLLIEKELIRELLTPIRDSSYHLRLINERESFKSVSALKPKIKFWLTKRGAKEKKVYCQLKAFIVGDNNKIIIIIMSLGTNLNNARCKKK